MTPVRRPAIQPAALFPLIAPAMTPVDLAIFREARELLADVGTRLND